MKNKSFNNIRKKPLSRAISTSLLVMAPFSIQANVFELPAGTIGGTSYISFNQTNLATMFSEYQHTTNTGVPYGDPLPTSDTTGNRFLYVDRFIDSTQDSTIKYSGLASDYRIAHGTADPVAVEQWRVFDPSQSVPLTQPTGGYQMPVDGLSVGVDWAKQGLYGWMPSIYDPNPNPDPNSGTSIQISLGGTFRMHSDFAAPGGALWFNNLGLQYSWNYYGDTPRWYISDLSGQGQGTIFELINPEFGVDAYGQFSLEADFKWGQSQWADFFRIVGSDPAEKVMGHLSINPIVDPTTVIPVPGAVWLFGSALLGLVGIKRRPLKSTV